MQVATGAMGSLLPKLAELLMEEYNLQKGVRKDVESLAREMKSMHAVLRKVGEVPRGQLDEQVKLWADEVRELSYKMEDVVDTFLVRVNVRDQATTDNSHRLKQLIEKMGNLFTKGKTRREIASAIKDINKEVQGVANRRGRYTVDDIVVTPQSTTIDPRLRALYTEATELVGIYGKRDQDLIKLLSLGEQDVSKQKLKTVSIVGFGGLGKTTLARAVYNKIKGDFDCKAFVPVGRNPDVKKVFMEILIDLDKVKYTNFNLMVLNERQLIDELLEFLQDRRYLIVIDDIWDEKLWKDIRLAFSNRNNRGSRLITTTRIFSISKACCISADDMVYEMKPLCSHDSQMLFYKRIFPPRSGCPIEFEQVSKDILKKCGGVPLAIITIASILVSDQQIKSQDEWHGLLQSIGRGLAEDGSLQEMQRILSLSYYDLPSHLKACLLYLSVYPEDHMIDREQLIWKWVAESFVQCGKQGTSLFELGETYFNELVNRSMIQPIYSPMGHVTYCRVHDMVLDLICSLSSEDNFVTVLDDTADVPCQSTARRLSLQNRKKNHQASSLIDSLSTSQVRSITIFPPAINMMPPLSSFDVLRVLDLRGAHLCGGCSPVILRDIGKLFHLRYLSLADTGICKLPPEIGNLQFLQVLDVSGNRDLEELPLTVCKLRRLLYLGVDRECRLPDGLGNMTSLEVFKRTIVSVNTVQELGKLARLRVLHIRMTERSMELQEVFVACLCSLHNLTCLVLGGDFGCIDLLGERWVPPRHLQRFVSYAAIGFFSALPAWVKRDPSRLSNLSDLRIKLKGLQQEEVQILGSLPSLRYLLIHTTNQTHRLLLIGSDGFRSMIYFVLFCGPAAQVVFEPGALPSAERVVFSFGVRVAKDDGNGDFDMGLQGSMLSVREVSVTICRQGVRVGEAKEAEDSLGRSLHAHPNHPRTSFYMKPNIKDGAHNDDLCDDEEMQ